MLGLPEEEMQDQDKKEFRIRSAEGMGEMEHEKLKGERRGWPEGRRDWPRELYGPEAMGEMELGKPGELCIIWFSAMGEMEHEKLRGERRDWPKELCIQAPGTMVEMEHENVRVKRRVDRELSISGREAMGEI